jgi:hypothetical protein
VARSSDPIVAYIEVLYANRELVSRAYHDGSITDTADVNKGVRALEHAGAIRPFEAGTFKLTRTLQRHFDAATSKLRSYDRLARIAPQLERLKRLKQSMSDARRLGELRDMVNAESEFEDECFSIHESIQRNVFTLRALMDSQFATAKSLHEKKRQNLFYIAETRDLQADVLELIATQLPDHLVDDEMYELARIYKQMISQHQQAWVVQLAEIWNTIQRMLFKTREVQKRNANFAKALLLFQLHPRYEGPDVPVDDTSPPWLFKVDPVPVRPNPDVLRGGTLDDMASIAATLAAGPQRVARAEDFVPQQVADDGEPSRKVVELEPELYDIALHQFLIDVQSSVDGYGLSAYLWKFNRREFDDLSMAVWLQCLLIEEDGEEMDAFRLVPVFAPQQDEVSGTRVFSDVSVTSRLVNSFAEHH